MAIDDYNGGSVLAMRGKDCVVVCSDKRLGSNQLQTVEMNFPKCYEITPHTWLACCGLATDCQTLYRTLRFHKNLFHLREEREMKPSTVGMFLANQLYNRRFSPWFVSPIIAGVDPKTSEPFVQAYDFIGAPETVEDFAAAGCAAQEIMGACEAHWKPDMTAEELAECAAQCLLAGLERDCLSGWGAVLHIITKDEIIDRHLESRMD